MNAQDENDFGAAVLMIMALIETHPDKPRLARVLRTMLDSMHAGLAAHGQTMDRASLEASLGQYLELLEGPASQ